MARPDCPMHNPVVCWVGGGGTLTPEMEVWISPFSRLKPLRGINNGPMFTFQRIQTQHVIAEETFKLSVARAGWCTLEKLSLEASKNKGTQTRITWLFLPCRPKSKAQNVKEPNETTASAFVFKAAVNLAALSCYHYQSDDRLQWGQCVHKQGGRFDGPINERVAYVRSSVYKRLQWRLIRKCEVLVLVFSRALLLARSDSTSHSAISSVWLFVPGRTSAPPPTPKLPPPQTWFLGS